MKTLPVDSFRSFLCVFWVAGALSLVFPATIFSEEFSGDNVENLLELSTTYESGDYDLLIEDCNLALDKGPNALVFHLRGKGYFAKGQYDMATADFRRALELAPQNPVFIGDLALAYFRRRYLREAIGYAQKAAELDPQNARAWSLLGDFHLENKDLGEAIVSYQEAARAAPGDFSPLEKMGNIFLKLGNIDQAIQLFTRSLALNPGEADRARIYVARKQAYAKKFSANDNAARATRGD